MSKDQDFCTIQALRREVDDKHKLTVGLALEAGRWKKLAEQLATSIRASAYQSKGQRTALAAFDRKANERAA